MNYKSRALLYGLLFLLLLLTPRIALSRDQTVVVETLELLTAPADDTEAGPVAVLFKFHTGPEQGDTFIHQTHQWGEPLYDRNFQPGNRFIGTAEYRENERISFSLGEQQREHGLLLLFLIVTLVLFIIGRWEGLVGLSSAVLSGGLFFFFLFPASLAGFPLLPLAIIICMLTVLYTIFFVTGFQRAAYPAILALLAGLLLTFIYSNWAYGFFHLDANRARHARLILTWMDHQTGLTPTNLGHLIISGIVLSTLGAMMDVAIVIGSTIDEISRDQKNLPFIQLFKSGQRVGGQILSTMINTLFFAYLGVMLPALLAFELFEISWMKYLNYDFIGIEILRISAALVGLALIIPLSSTITAWWCKQDV